MKTFHTIQISQPVEMVWDHLLLQGGTSFWMGNVEISRLLKGKATEQGAMFRLIVNENGRSVLREETILKCIPYQEYSSFLSDENFDAIFSIKLAEIDSLTTKVSFIMSANFNSFIYRFMAKWHKDKFDKQHKDALNKMKNELEQYSYSPKTEPAI